MTYSPIDPPISLGFEGASRADLKRYGAWFHRVLPARIEELTRAITADSRFSGWRPDMTPESLEMVGEWLAEQVEMRKVSNEERAEIASKLSFPIDIPDEELSSRTLSLAVDVGMYFSQVVLCALPGTEWDQPFGSKRFADYGQPVLTGFGKKMLNPVRIVVTTARGMAAKEHDGRRLRELYEVWASLAT